MDILAKERQRHIEEFLRKDGAVNTSKLVEEFQVSIETVRRDFLAMEQAGILNRVHGGAVAVGGMQTFHELQTRNEEHSSGKQELAGYACQFIQEGDYLALDAGSTSPHLAEMLKRKYNRLTVVTYSSDVYEILRDNPGIQVILCGGYYMPGERAFYGSFTLEMLNKLHVQKAFICPSAISLEHGICDFQQDIYLLQQKLLEISDHIYILADSSKYEKRGLLKLDEMNPEYHYITDSGLSPELKRIYLENQMQVCNEINSK